MTTTLKRIQRFESRFVGIRRLGLRKTGRQAAIDAVNLRRLAVRNDFEVISAD